MAQLHVVAMKIAAMSTPVLIVYDPERTKSLNVALDAMRSFDHDSTRHSRNFQGAAFDPI
jgi:hypothetical protein